MRKPTPTRRIKNKRLLLALADRLDQVKPKDFNMMSYAHDALYYAAHMPEFVKAGFTYAANDNQEPGLHKTWFRGKADLEAAAFFFDISIYEAQHLFSNHEFDPWGYTHKTMFGGRDGDIGRDREPPTWTAKRIRTFVQEFPHFDNYKAALRVS